jgi:hypothetical protein
LTVAGLSSTSAVTITGTVTITGVATVAGLSTSGTITSSASVYATSFITASDAALKVIVAPLEARAADLFALRGLSFHYRRRPDGTVSADGQPDLNRTHFGFLAQEVEGPFPELVGRSPSTGLRDVAYQAFVPLLVEGLKGHRRELSALKTQVAAGSDAQERAILGLSERLDAILTVASFLQLPPPPVSVVSSDVGVGSLRAGRSLFEGNAGSATASAHNINIEGLAATSSVTSHYDLEKDSSATVATSMVATAPSAIATVFTATGEEVDAGKTMPQHLNFLGTIGDTSSARRQSYGNDSQNAITELRDEVATLRHDLVAAEARFEFDLKLQGKFIEGLHLAMKEIQAAVGKNLRM